jgi:hypothetical protein
VLKKMLWKRFVVEEGEDGSFERSLIELLE